MQLAATSGKHTLELLITNRPRTSFHLKSTKSHNLGNSPTPNSHLLTEESNQANRVPYPTRCWEFKLAALTHTQDVTVGGGWLGQELVFLFYLAMRKICKSFTGDRNGKVQPLTRNSYGRCLSDMKDMKRYRAETGSRQDTTTHIHFKFYFASCMVFR